jgi:hypothetical protein
MGNDRQIRWLIKFFTEEDHADQFLRGRLLLRRLSHFKRIENAADTTRRDPTEAVGAWLQPKGLRINFLAPGMSHLDITDKDLAGPVSISFDEHDHLHLYCMYAVHTSGFDFGEDGKVELSPEQVAELERQLTIDPRCLEFGRFAVIVRAVDFIDRLTATLRERRQWARLKLVDYYDDQAFNGQFPNENIAFHKQMRFAYQQEFRICVRTGTRGDDPLWIDIGDIGDISGKVEAAQLNSTFKVNVEPVAGSGSSAIRPA